MGVVTAQVPKCREVHGQRVLFSILQRSACALYAFYVPQYLMNTLCVCGGWGAEGVHLAQHQIK